MIFQFLTLLFLCVCGVPCHAEDASSASLTIVRGTVSKEMTGGDLQSKLKPETVEIEDPVYHKHKRYAGYWLSDILELAGTLPDSNAVLTFTALDGYKVQIAVADVVRAKARALVAVKDLDAPDPDGWEKIQQGKEWVSPAPYYLVWTAPVALDEKFPWPYQLAQIWITSTDLARQKLLPDGAEKSEAVARGYEVFAAHCMACHSLNLEGGALGPELNIPKNILEYRDRKFLKQFIQDPSSFRARNKMPGFKDTVSDPSLEDLLDYLAWMGKHKEQ